MDPQRETGGSTRGLSRKMAETGGEYVCKHRVTFKILQLLNTKTK